jgi:multiple sugar transport system substrate-binding protein
MSELADYAKKLTTKDKSGKLDVVGYDPAQGFYENAPAHYAPLFGAEWVNADGKSSLAASPGWTEFLNWQKSLVDSYGYDALRRWQAGAGEEFSPQNAFERGKLAMAMDGEFRTAFIKAEHPELDYGTAPMPVSDSHPELYGAGYVTGTSSASRRRRRTRTPPGSSSATSRPTTTRWRSCPTACVTSRRRSLR